MPVDKYNPPSQIVATNPDDARVLSLAQALYGEFAGVSDDNLQREYMVMGASAFKNSEGIREWRELDWDTHLYARSNAVRDANVPYQQALKGEFNTEAEKRAWRRAVQISYGIEQGYIKPMVGQFFITPREYNRQTKKGLLDGSLLEQVGKVGKYNLYSYKETPARSRRKGRSKALRPSAEK